MTEESKLRSKHLIICLGPGGVGKTTLSAALAVYGAVRGRTVSVLTFDPSPRLLDVLGLDTSRPEPQEVPLEGVAIGPSRRVRRGGRLFAQRLDPKHTFDALVRRYARSRSACDVILNNRIYRSLSAALSGVADYMAMEKLLELNDERPDDLIVLDTPPASEALDFLDAPRRLLDLLNSRALALLGASGGLVKVRLGLLDFAARAVLAAFDRLTGFHLLGDVQAFVASFDGMYAGFAERAARARDLLRDSGSEVTVVTTAEAGRIDQVSDFVGGLNRAGLRVGALIVNRLMPALPDAKELADPRIPAALRRKLRRNLSDFSALKQRETLALKGLRTAVPAPTDIFIVPDLGHEPRTIADLAEIGRSLSRG